MGFTAVPSAQSKFAGGTPGRVLQGSYVIAGSRKVLALLGQVNSAPPSSIASMMHKS